MKVRVFLEKLGRYATSPDGIATLWRAFRDRRAVARSPLFDRDWYLRQNPEVGATGTDPALHYLVIGHLSGLNPGPGFCGAEYLALHPEAAGSNPLVHYERVGRRRGFRISFLQPEGADSAAWRFPTVAEHQAAFPAKVAAIRAKAASGERVRAVFFVASAAMFPARPLFDAMRRDPRFDARVAPIPDLRGLGAEPDAALARCRSALARDLPEEAILPVARNPDGSWPDVLSDFGADLVCHPSPYELSDFRYNPRWCVGRRVLPIHVNYGYFRSAYDRDVMARESYALFWKAFFECDATLAEYRAHSVLHGANADVVGYVKMDRLAAFPHRPARRPRVLICPHHSVEGGLNDKLGLSNFLRLADDLLALPEKFPAIDFALRPHPFLFPVLSRPKFWGPEKARAWRDAFLARPNARWSEGGDQFADFAWADAIVQDCGSFLVEWFYTGRPCCYLLRSEADFDKFSPLGRDCLRHCRIAFDGAGIDAFLRDVVLAGRDELAEDREAFRRTVMINHPHASEAALASIGRALFGPPPS